MIAPSSPTRQQVCKIVYFSSRCKQLWIFILQVTVLRLVPVPRSCLTCDPLSGYSTSSILLAIIGTCKPLYRDKLETIERLCTIFGTHLSCQVDLNHFWTFNQQYIFHHHINHLIMVGITFINTQNSQNKINSVLYWIHSFHWS